MAEESHQVEHAIHSMYAISKTRDQERLSYMLHVQKNTIWIISHKSSMIWACAKVIRSPPKSSKGGDIRTKNVFEGFLTK